MDENGILFLDIDGVLNSIAYAQRVKPRGIWGIDTEAIPHLQRILETTGCDVVLSSTWRLLHSLVEMRGILHEAGLTCPIRFIDKTPILQKEIRGAEVYKWIKDMRYEGRYVILDDNSDFLEDQPLVQTNFAVGLTAEDAARCIAILRGEA